MRLLYTLLSLLLLANSYTITAQLPYKLLKQKNKVYSFITNGYFYKAQKTNNKYITKLQTSAYKQELPSAYLNKAQISMFLGKNSLIWEGFIKKGEQELLKAGTSVEKVNFYAKISLLYSSYGNFNFAQKYLDKTKQFKQKNNTSEDSYWYEFAKATLATKQGYFTLAITDLTDFSKLYLSTIKTTVTGVKKGKEFTKKKSAKEFVGQQRKYVDLLNLKTKALLSSGNFKEADVSLYTARTWIINNINKKDISYIDNKILEGEIALAKEDYPTATKIFDAIYNKNIDKTNHGTRYKPTSPKYLNFIGLTATAYWLNDRNHSAQQIYNHIEPKIKRYYKKATPHRSWINALKGQKYFHKGNFKKSIHIFENVLADTAKLFKDHPSRLEIANFLLNSYLAQRDYKKPVALMKEIDRLNEKINLIGSPTYYRYRLNEANYITQYSNDINKATEAFTTGLAKIKAGGVFEQSPDYIDFKNDKALYLIEFNKFNEALSLMKATTNDVLNTYGKAHFRYGNQLERLANLYLITGNYSLAYKNAVKSKETLHSYPSQKINKAQSLRTYANTCIVRGQFRDAEKALKKAQDLTEDSDVNLDIDEFSRLYIDNGEYSRVEEILLNSLQSKTDFFGEDNKRTLAPLQQLTELYLILGDFPKADEYNDKAMLLSETIFGVNSLQHSVILKQKAEINSAIGDYSTAITGYKEVLTLEKRIFGKTAIIPAETSMKLVLNQYYNGEKSDRIEQSLVHSVETIKSNFDDKNNPLVAKALTQLSIYQIEINKLDLAERNLLDANEIWQKRTNLKKGNKHTAKILALRGAIHAKKGSYPRALALYTDATSMYKKIFSTSHPDYVHNYSKLGQMYYISGNEKKALQITEKSALLNMELVKNFFPALSERGKAKFWATHKSDFEFYNTLAFKYHEKKPKLVANVYDFILSTKYLLLNSSLKIRQNILSSGDTSLIKKYRLYQSKREDLFKTMTASQDVLTTNTESRGKLEKEIESLEEELSKQSALFGSTVKKKNATWKDIKGALKSNENAIEIIRYRYFDKSFSDSIVYVALIINAETKKAPAVVVLPNGNNMEAGFLKYYRNAVKFRMKDKKSHERYWAPIAKKIQPNSTVYLSAEGAYTQLNMETFYTPSNQYLINEYSLVLLTNTKDLLHKNTKGKATSLPALFANPSFYIANQKNKSHKNTSVNQSIRQLSGAEREVKSIEKILDKQGSKYKDYTYGLATEQALKELKSPQFLHLATHGYFIKNAEAVNSEIDSDRALENPLLKSGILLANAGELVDNELFYNYNKNDGVLTSLEAMNLNLDNTEFVVLSACETGLGEIKNGEGVYGLQRALQLAGANTIFMSLFKVDDEVTNKLMTLFYQKYFILNNKRQAFVAAKKELMKEYDAPYFWGAFIMIE